MHARTYVSMPAARCIPGLLESCVLRIAIDFSPPPLPLPTHLCCCRNSSFPCYVNSHVVDAFTLHRSGIHHLLAVGFFISSSQIINRDRLVNHSSLRHITVRLLQLRTYVRT